MKQLQWMEETGTHNFGRRTSQCKSLQNTVTADMDNTKQETN